MKRREYAFRVTPDVFHFALFLDAQRWTGSRAPVGFRTETIKFLKTYCTAYLKIWYRTRDQRPDGEPLCWWDFWRPSRRPVWRVTVYGLTYDFPQYMDADRLAALMHLHHRTVKGTRHWWCLYCNPDRGGTVQDIGALEAAEDFLEVTNQPLLPRVSDL